MTDGQIVRFKIGEAFPADDQLARWMTVCAMAMNDLLVVNQLLIPRLKEEIPSGPGEIFYLGRVAAGHLFEVATFLRKSDRIPAISRFVAGLDVEEAQAAYQELLQIGEGGSGKFHEQLKHARNKSFHYQELLRGDHEDREPVKQALAAHAREELESGDARGEIQRHSATANRGFAPSSLTTSPQRCCYPRTRIKSSALRRKCLRAHRFIHDFHEGRPERLLGD